MVYRGQSSHLIQQVGPLLQPQTLIYVLSSNKIRCNGSVKDLCVKSSSSVVQRLSGQMSV